MMQTDNVHFTFMYSFGVSQQHGVSLLQRWQALLGEVPTLSDPDMPVLVKLGIAAALKTAQALCQAEMIAQVKETFLR